MVDNAAIQTLRHGLHVRRIASQHADDDLVHRVARSRCTVRGGAVAGGVAAPCRKPVRWTRVAVRMLSRHLVNLALPHLGRPSPLHLCRGRHRSITVGGRTTSSCKGWRRRCRCAAKILVQGLAVLVVAEPSAAVEPIQFRSYANGGEFHVSTEMVLHAPADAVRAVLTDFVHSYRLNPAITESAILPSVEAGVVRLRMRMNDCVASFCLDMVSVADITERPSGDLEVVVIPELSSFRSGSAEWHIQSGPAETRVRYELRLEPDFFIPPPIGGMIVIRKLRNETFATFRRLECIAQVRAERGQGHPRRYTDAELPHGCLDDDI